MLQNLACNFFLQCVLKLICPNTKCNIHCTFSVTFEVIFRQENLYFGIILNYIANFYSHAVVVVFFVILYLMVSRQGVLIVFWPYVSILLHLYFQLPYLP